MTSTRCYGRPKRAASTGSCSTCLLPGRTLGVHNFYLGYTTKGIIQLVLTLTFIGLIVSGIWAFIDFIMLLMRSGDYATDAQGQPLQ